MLSGNVAHDMGALRREISGHSLFWRLRLALRQAMLILFSPRYGW